jgi:hypothetical protein
VHANTDQFSMRKKLSNNPIYPTSVRVDVWRAASLLPIRQFYSVTMMLSQPFLMLAVAPTGGTAEGFGCCRGIGRCVGRGLCNGRTTCEWFVSRRGVCGVCYSLLLFLFFFSNLRSASHNDYTALRYSGTCSPSYSIVAFALHSRPNSRGTICKPRSNI